MLEGFGAIVRKDLRLEMRSGESLVSLISLSLLILVVMVLAFGPGGTRRAEVAGGALWIALIFAGTLGASRSLLAEHENGCIRGLLLSPVEPATIYAAKLAVALIFMTEAGAAVLVMLVLFFNLEFGAGLLRVIPVFLLGALGLSAVCTLLASVSGRARAAALLLPVLVVPLFTPALIAGSKASAALLSGQPLAAVATWLKLLAAFDVLFVTAGYLLFEHVILED
jgi:heme exporter protein B